MLVLKDLSVVIVNYRCWEKLSKCLNSLITINEAYFTFEVIVVDNASHDKMLGEFRVLYPQYRFIQNSGNYGFASGCNLGASNANGKYLLFLNPDTIVSGKALSAMLDQAKVSKANSIISCRQIKKNGNEDKPYGIFPSPLTLTGWSRAFARLLKLNNKLLQDERFIFPDWISGSVVMMSRISFNTIGGWNERFWMYFEDVDLCQRAKEAGGTVFLLKSVTIVHNHGGSSRSNNRIIALTKTEVNISRHSYISLHEHGFKGAFMQTFLVLNNVLSGFIPALLGLFLFFNKTFLTSTNIYLNLLNYYFNALLKDTWISPRSVMYAKFSPNDHYPDEKLVPLSEDNTKRA